MTNKERQLLTTLEIAVWAAMYSARFAVLFHGARNVSDLMDPIEYADEMIDRMRQQLAERLTRETIEHKLRLIHSYRCARHPNNGCPDAQCTCRISIGCACGYRPPAGMDAEDMITIHLARFYSPLPALPLERTPP